MINRILQRINRDEIVPEGEIRSFAALIEDLKMGVRAFRGILKGNTKDIGVYGLQVDGDANVSGSLDVAGGSTLNGGVVINEPGADVDFRVETDGDTHTIFAEGSSDNVGIGVASPTAALHLKAGTATASTAPLKFSSGTNLTAAEAGVLEYDGGCLYFTEVVDRRCVSMASDSIIASTVSTSTDETTIYTGTISAAELTAGKVIRVKAFGSFTTHDASDQVTIKLKLGTITVVTLQSTAGAAETEPWHLEGNMTIRTIGGSGTVSGHGHIMLKTTEVHTNTESTAIATTGANNVTITAQWSDASNSISIDQAYMEVLV